MDEDKFADQDSKYVPEIDFKTVKIFEKKNSISCSIFFYKGHWNFSCFCSNNMYTKQYCFRYLLKIKKRKARRKRERERKKVKRRQER